MGISSTVLGPAPTDYNQQSGDSGEVGVWRSEGGLSLVGVAMSRIVANPVISVDLCVHALQKPRSVSAVWLFLKAGKNYRPRYPALLDEPYRLLCFTCTFHRNRVELYCFECRNRFCFEFVRESLRGNGIDFGENVYRGGILEIWRICLFYWMRITGPTEAISWCYSLLLSMLHC